MITTMSPRTFARNYIHILPRVQLGEIFGLIKNEEIVAVIRSPKDRDLRADAPEVIEGEIVPTEPVVTENTIYENK